MDATPPWGNVPCWPSSAPRCSNPRTRLWASSFRSIGCTTAFTMLSRARRTTVFFRPNACWTPISRTSPSGCSRCCCWSSMWRASSPTHTTCASCSPMVSMPTLSTWNGASVRRCGCWNMRRTCSEWGRATNTSPMRSRISSRRSRISTSTTPASSASSRISCSMTSLGGSRFSTVHRKRILISDCVSIRCSRAFNGRFGWMCQRLWTPMVARMPGAPAWAPVTPSRCYWGRMIRRCSMTSGCM